MPKGKKKGGRKRASATRAASSSSSRAERPAGAPAAKAASIKTRAAPASS